MQFCFHSSCTCFTFGTVDNNSFELESDDVIDFLNPNGKWCLCVRSLENISVNIHLLNYHAYMKWDFWYFVEIWSQNLSHISGCTTTCGKNICSCFRNGVPCTPLCKCSDNECFNVQFHNCIRILSRLCSLLIIDCVCSNTDH